MGELFVIMALLGTSDGLLVLGEVLRSSGVETLLITALGGGALTVIFSMVTPPFVTIGTSSNGGGGVSGHASELLKGLLELDIASRHCAA